MTDELTPQQSGWECEAYGPGGAAVGALCFVAGDLGQRVCATTAECAAQVRGERRRVFRRINELAAAGDVAGEYLEGAISSPDQLLGGPGPDEDERSDGGKD